MDDPKIDLKNTSNETLTSFKLQPKTKNLWSNFDKSLNYKDDPWIISNAMKYNINNEDLDLLEPIYVLSSFEMSKDVYFYEIEILKNVFNRKILTGWITKFVNFNDCFFFEKSKDTHNNKFFIFDEINLLSGIIGCLVNLVKQTINVYLNGKPVLVYKNKNVFENLPIFALIIVQFGQTIRVNFGNTTFKYPPFNEHYETFHSITLKKIPSFQIKLTNNIKWFCKKNLNGWFDDNMLQVFDYNQNNLEINFRFNDLKQKQFDKKVVEITTMINNGKDYETITNFIFSKTENLNDLQNYCLLQAIEKVSGYKIETNQMSKFDHCIFLILENISKCNETIYHLFLHECVFNFFKTNKFQILNLKNQTELHYTCLILFYVTKNVSCCKSLIKRCKLIFHQVLKHSTDPWSQLYSIMGLKENVLTSSFISAPYFLNKFLKKNKAPFLIWRNSLNKKNALQNTRVTKNSAQLQLYQYLQYYMPKTSKTKNDKVFTKNFDIETYFIDSCIFSFYNLMVRNDNTEYETIRYKFSISSPTFYFEVTIITVGKMRIGLAAKQMNIKDVVGQNSLSIGIDGYHRCVWMHKQKYKFKNSCPLWNAGDVIGIYVDFKNPSIIFGINEEIIELDGDPLEEEFIFSILPCQIAASLWKYQQCFFNFDCEVIPQTFLNNLKTIYQSDNFINSVFISKTTTPVENITINDMSNPYNMQNLNYDKQLNIIMKNDETATKSLRTWSIVTEKVNLAYGRVLSKGYKGDNRITFNACEQWRRQLESILNDIKYPEHFFVYMQMINKIHKKLKNDAKKSNKKASPHNQPLMLMPAPVQLEQSNFSLWLNSLMMVLGADGVVQAVESPLPKNHPLNLIACGRILQRVPNELQTPIQKLKIAYYMLKELRQKYEKNDKFLKMSTVNVSRKRALPCFDENDSHSVKQRNNQPYTNWASSSKN